MPVVTIYFGDEEYKELVKIRDSMQTSLSHVVRLLVNKSLKDEKVNEYEVGSR